MKRTKKQVGIVLPFISEDKKIVEWKSEAEMEIAKSIHSMLNFTNIKNKKIEDKNLNASHYLTLMLHARQICIYPKLVTKYLNDITKKNKMYEEGITCSSKLDEAINSILEKKDNGCGKIIFCNFREEIDEVAGRLSKSGMRVAVFDGRTNHSVRSSILNSEYDALVLQIQTGCEGLNLQANYSEIYFISPHWNPAVEDQAIARCHRIGQTKPVYVKRFEMIDFPTHEELNLPSISIDKYINRIQYTKRLIADECLNST